MIEYANDIIGEAIKKPNTMFRPYDTSYPFIDFAFATDVGGKKHIHAFQATTGGSHSSKTDQIKVFLKQIGSCSAYVYYLVPYLAQPTVSPVPFSDAQPTPTPMSLSPTFSPSSTAPSSSSQPSTSTKPSTYPSTSNRPSTALSNQPSPPPTIPAPCPSQGALIATNLSCSASSRCRGQNLMYKWSLLKCDVRCIVQEYYRLSYNRSWRCGSCSLFRL
jgi:hypothetical protein